MPELHPGKGSVSWGGSVEPGAGGEPAGPCHGNSAQAPQSHRLPLAPVRPGSCIWAGRAAQSTCSLPAAVSICPAQLCPAPPAAGTSRELRGREGSSVQPGGCSKSAGRQPSSEQREGPALCQHSKALLPVSGFTMKVMAAHVGALLHFVHAPQSLWHLQESKTASGI